MASIIQFVSGATKSTPENKLDPEGFLSPIALAEFMRYMHKNRLQPDGAYRESDNWQLGIPQSQYAKSLWRHFHDFWLLHRGYAAIHDPDANLKKELCAIIFNAQGYLHEICKYNEPDRTQ